MQAIILAAGISKRLRPLTDSTPKCLLNIGDKNLLHRTLDNIVRNNISDFIIVTGYRENMIKEYILNNFGDINVQFLTNTDYENNNNSYSLWMTKNFVKNDIILLDSDILFEPEIITKLLNAPYNNCLAVNVTKQLDEEQIKVLINHENKILEIGKTVAIDKSEGESVGIEKFSTNFMKELFVVLVRKILKEQNVNEFYEVSFQEIIDRSDKENSIYSVDISEFKCMEIDTIEDYKNAQNFKL